MTGRTWLRRIGLVAAAIVFLAACTDSATMSPLSKPSSPGAPRTTAAEPPSTITGSEVFVAPIVGYLPDGTDFVVYLRSHEPEDLTEITADVFYEGLDGAWLLGTSSFAPRSTTFTGLIDGTYTVSAGSSWTVTFDLTDEVLEHLGPDAEPVLQAGIRGTEMAAFGLRYPVLELSAPFRWATASDPTGPMRVLYDSIVVRPGCDSDSLGCSWSRIVQVVAGQGYTADGATIESRSRPISDPAYLDPGPLTPRDAPDVLWTGDEMLVWGGGTSDGRFQTDGAVFDPGLSTWRTLPLSPLPVNTQSRAVWGDGELVVVSGQGTFAYDPADLTWRVIAGDIAPPGGPGEMISIDGTVYMWVAGGVYELSPEEGNWQRLPEPGGQTGVLSHATLLDLDGDLLLSGKGDHSCPVRNRSLYLFHEGVWEELTGFETGTETSPDCSPASNAAVIDGRVFVWGDEWMQWYSHDDGSFAELADVSPPRESDGSSGPLLIDGRILVPQADVGVIFDPVTGRWTGVEMPGYGDATYMIWTGDEILTWFGEWRDAWRWAPG